MSRNKAKSKVKTAKGRKSASTRWLQRQINDPYVAEAQRLGYRSRAIFKIIELDEKVGLFKPGLKVVDLGAAPGGWSQFAASKGCKVLATDILEMDVLADVNFIQKDFTEADAPDMLITALGGKADIVMSDMAPNTIGHKQTDHLRIMAMVELAYDFALSVLRENGTFLAKVLQGGTQDEILRMMKQDFTTVRHIKPPASRKQSSEQYVVATGFRRSNQ